MAQTLFKILRQQHPKTHLTVLAPKWSFALLQRMPEVDEAIPLDIVHGELGIKKRYKIARKLRAHEYSQAIILPNSFKSALIPLFVKIPVRTGWRGEMRWGLLNDLRRPNKKKYPKLVERYAALAYAKETPLPTDLPWPRLKTMPLAANFQQTLSKDKKMLALCPGAEHGPAKRWPAEYFAKLALAKQHDNWDVILLGSSNDKKIAAEIMRLTKNSCVNFVGETTITEAIDLIAGANVVVTNDSGLMHVAAAVDCPQIIAIYGPSSPDFTPPLTHNAQIVTTQIECRPCFKRTCPLKHHHCMRKIKPEQIIEFLD